MRRTIGFWLFILPALLVGAEPTLSRLDTPPRPKRQTAPEYPAELKEQHVIGAASLQCTIDENGAVKDIQIADASQPEFGAAAVAAVAHWEYFPATRGGRPQAVKVGIPVEFNLSEAELAEMEARRVKETLPPGPPLLAVAEVDEWPGLKKEIRPKTPATLMQSRRMGQARIGFVVDEEGVPRDVHPLASTHAECTAAAMAAIGQWRFSPAKKEGRAVRVSLDIPIVFFPENPSANGARVRPGVSSVLDVNEVSRIAAAEGGRYTPPRVRQQPAIEFPEEMARRGQIGRVLMEFIIDPRGRVTQVRTVDQTNAFFSTLAERAVSHWTFFPAQRNGIPVSCYAKQLVEFEY